MDFSEIKDALGTCEFFKGLEENYIEKVATLCRMEIYKGGEYIFQQNDYCEYLYVVVDGQVSLERSIDLGSRKGSVHIETLGKGRVLGCWSALLGTPHNLLSSAICEKSTRILVLKGLELRQMMLENKTLGFMVLQRFCFLLRDRIQAAYGALERI